MDAEVKQDAIILKGNNRVFCFQLHEWSMDIGRILEGKAVFDGIF